MVVRDDRLMKAALEMVGDPAARARGLDAFTADTDRLDAQWDDVVEQYDEQWIAFYRGGVVANGCDPQHVVRTMRALGVPPGQGILRFLSSKPLRMIL